MAAETKQPEAKKRFIKYKLPEDRPVTVSDIETYCKEQGINPENAVFIFPGDVNSYHYPRSAKDYGRNLALYHTTIKGEDLAAKLADQWAKKGYPCLSLPTIPIDIFQQSMCDVWKVVGAGFSVILPTFGENNLYQGLRSVNNYGQITPRSELEKLENFCNSPLQDQQNRMDLLQKQQSDVYIDWDYRMNYGVGEKYNTPAARSHSPWWRKPPDLPATITVTSNITPATPPSPPKTPIKPETVVESTPLLSQHLPLSNTSAINPTIKRLSNKTQWILLVLTAICVGALVTVAIVPTDAIGKIGLQILFPILATILTAFVLGLVKNANCKPQTKSNLAIGGAALFTGIATFVALLFFGQGVAASKTFDFHHLDALYVLPLPISVFIVGIAAFMINKDLKPLFTRSAYTPLNPIASQDSLHGTPNAHVANQGALPVPDKYRNNAQTASADSQPPPSSSSGDRTTTSFTPLNPNNDPGSSAHLFT